MDSQKKAKTSAAGARTVVVALPHTSFFPADIEVLDSVKGDADFAFFLLFAILSALSKLALPESIQNLGVSTAVVLTWLGYSQK